MDNHRWMQRDLAHIWHPCTQMKDHEFLPLIPIKRGKGVWLYDFEGKGYIDAIGSWWVNLFGHANERINSAIAKQAATLEHVILAGFSHEAAIRLAEKLVAIAPKPLNKLFYADNGSSAIEVALKMSYHYHKNRGYDKPLFLSLTNSYHGETIGALSVGDVALYKQTYEPLLMQNMQVSVPSDASKEAAVKAASLFEETLQKHHRQISALILEPLVQGAGGMHIYHPHYLQKARELTSRFGVHLIADEVMTGFGRTGTMFACEQAGIAPDFMVLSKGLTGGYLPLSTVLTTDEVYSAFYCDYEEQKAFLHSHSYTGNALACSAALATLEIFEEENVIETNRQKSELIWEQMQPFFALENVENVRRLGMIFAVTLKGYDPKLRMGLKVYEYGLKRGVLLRPLGNVIYFMPPYIINESEIEQMVTTAIEAVKALDS